MNNFKKVFNWAIGIIIVVGVIGGIGAGGIFAVPSEKALDYPSLYGDEKVWSFASVIAMLCVWGSTYLTAAIFYGFKKIIEILEEISQNGVTLYKEIKNKEKSVNE